MLKAITIILVSILFGSAFYFFISRIVLYRFLSERGVKVAFGLSGLPGYLENLYLSSDPNIRNSEGDRIIHPIKFSFRIILITSIGLFLVRVIL